MRKRSCSVMGAMGHVIPFAPGWMLFPLANGFVATAKRMLEYSSRTESLLGKEQAPSKGYMALDQLHLRHGRRYGNLSGTRSIWIWIFRLMTKSHNRGRQKHRGVNLTSGSGAFGSQQDKEALRDFEIRPALCSTIEHLAKDHLGPSQSRRTS